MTSRALSRPPIALSLSLPFCEWASSTGLLGLLEGSKGLTDVSTQPKVWHLERSGGPRVDQAEGTLDSELPDHAPSSPAECLCLSLL